MPCPSAGSARSASASVTEGHRRPSQNWRGQLRVQRRVAANFSNRWTVCQTSPGVGKGDWQQRTSDVCSDDLPWSLKARVYSDLSIVVWPPRCYISAVEKRQCSFQLSAEAVESLDGGRGRNVAVVVGTESSCRRRAWTLDVIAASPWSSAQEAVVAGQCGRWTGSQRRSGRRHWKQLSPESLDVGRDRNVAVVVGTRSSRRRTVWTLDEVATSLWSSARRQLSASVVGWTRTLGQQRALVT